MSGQKVAFWLKIRIQLISQHIILKTMEQPFLLVGIIIAVILIFNVLLLYYLRQVYGRDKQIAEFIRSNDTLILSEAQQKAKSIIDAATLRAKQTLTDTEYVKNEFMKKMEDLLSQTAHNDIKLLQNKSNEINDWYKKVLDSVKQEHAQKAEESLKSVEGIVDQQLQDFRQILKKETIESEQIVSQRVNSEYTKVHQEIEQYKAQKIQEINLATNQVIHQITEEVLGKAIPLEDHQKLILDALEKAKTEGLFSAPK